MTLADAYEIVTPIQHFRPNPPRLALAPSPPPPPPPSSKAENTRMAAEYLRAAAASLLATARDLENEAVREIVRSRNDLPGIRFSIDCAEARLLRDAQHEYGECLSDGRPLPDPFVNQPRW